MSLISWLGPALAAFFIYGIGQGLVKKYADDVPPAQFCLWLVVAKAIVNLGFFFSATHGPLFVPQSGAFVVTGISAYVLEGLGWILYFESVVWGPITIVGTLSAAYPAFTVLFARVFLGEVLSRWQYIGVMLLIAGCIGLSYSPSSTSSKGRRWIPMALSALVLWGAAQTLVKFSYTLPNSSEVSLSLLNTIGGALTLGLYGLTRADFRSLRAQWAQSFFPMAMMATGDLLVIVASLHGPVSLVTPISGAYPLVTLVFAWIVLQERLNALQWGCVALVAAGMVLGPGF